jgi:hypothetical protein
MKKITLNTANTKKLELKKTAIANLQMSEEKMRLVIGGNWTGDDIPSGGRPNCNSATISLHETN